MMKLICACALLFSFTFTYTVANAQGLAEPQLEKIPNKLTKHQDTRIDNYFWLKDRTNSKVINYLNAENSYAEEKLKDMLEIQEKVYQEMRGRIKEDDTSMPYKKGDYQYYFRTLTGKEYKIYCRKKDDKGDIGPEEILLDVNKLAENKAFLKVPWPVVHYSQNLIAYSEDIKGDRVHTIYFKDLISGKNLDHKIEGVTGNMVWAESGRVIFYTKHDPQTLRSDKVFKFDLDTGKTLLVYAEQDEKFEVYIGKALSNKFLYIYSGSTLSSEVQFAFASDLNATFNIFLKREKNHEYTIEDMGDKFVIRTNWQAKNFRVMTTPYGQTNKSNWKKLIAHRADTFIEEAQPFKNHLVLGVRRDGLTAIEVLSAATAKLDVVTFTDPVYMASVAYNGEFDTNAIRYEYESPNRPESVFEYNFEKKTSMLLKEKEVPGYISANYTSERIFALGKDGVSIPVTLVYKKGFSLNATAPVLVYGYGSYGSSMDPSFSQGVVSLLDRGFVFSIAHVRGGAEMGRKWYEDGKFLKKKNTFNDFIAVSEHLIKTKYADPKKLYAMGGSAGGLLMGAVLNMRPDLYHGVVAQVPFVDVVTTMLDSSIPLTTGEYEEWGNPNEKKYYRYMKSYSPYDNVRALAYPHLLVTTGLNDSQVGYWEPAKWVAKLRDMRTDKSKLLILKTEMEVGHGGKSGRFESLRERALEYAFFVKLAQ